MNLFGVKLSRESILKTHVLQRFVALVLIALFTAFLFIPDLSFKGPSYNIGDVARFDVRSNLTVDSEGISIKRGEIVVREGEIIVSATLARLELLDAVTPKKGGSLQIFGVFCFTFLLAGMGYLFASVNMKRFAPKRSKDLLLLAVIYASVVLLMRFSAITANALEPAFSSVPESTYIYLIPVAIGPMLVMLFLNAEVAFVFAAVVAIISGFFLGGSLSTAAYFFIGSVAAAFGVRFCTQRSTVIKAGVALGIVNAAVLLCIAAIGTDPTLRDATIMAAAGFVNGLLTAVLTVGVAPVFESIFRYTTNIKLLELARLDHPALRKLASTAPGTYHHSIAMGTLVEAAAESIDANPLLARVSAYYHDIGKTKKPDYFIENTQGANKHAKLTPSMSALIITNHVKEGADLARLYRLGPDISDIIVQHHGTSLMSFFYEKAKDEQGSGETPVSEGEFRYPGPKPQTKEAGLVMLADAIEAASKTIPDPTEDKIKGMVQKIVYKFFADGQLDDCELTLKDLHQITKSFNKAFTGVFHKRIDYPEPAYIKKGEKPLDGSTRRQGGAEEGSRGKDKKDSRENLKRLGM